jgi:hypothetical protein
MFTTAAQLLDLTDSKSFIVEKPVDLETDLAQRSLWLRFAMAGN